MAYFIYSHEALPNLKMFGRPGYTPDSEYIQYGGQRLPPIPEKQWTQLQDVFMGLRRSDWRDRLGTEVEIHVRKFKGVIDGRFAERGVIFLDHEPSLNEKQNLEEVSRSLNLSWRRQCIQWYEDQVREKEVTGHGRTKPTPYEDECYDILGMEKPYSVEALRAQRSPGKEAAIRIAEAIEQGQKSTAAAVVAGIKSMLEQPATKPPAR